jgi:signal transduction histidine kinase
MLTMARVESGVAPAHPASCDLNECICRAVTELETFAAIRQVDVAVCDIPPGISAVPLSEEDCNLVVTNLLMNALQHSPSQSRVDVCVQAESGMIKFTVQDHGEGIDPAVLPHVFERFYRGDPSRSRETGGSGLGLAICKAIVEKAGGTITLSSHSGNGTTATVRLPKS